MEIEPPELPRLRMGIAGFSAEQQERLAAVLANARTGIPWRLSELAMADAWCVNGARTLPLDASSVHVTPARAGEAPVRIEINNPDRPLAFALPLRAPGLADCPTFDLQSLKSTYAMLVRLQGWLGPTTMQFCLASKMVKDRLDLSSVYHVSVNGRLVAVISRRNGMGILPIVDPRLLEQATWARRPEIADEIPSHFAQCSLTEALWTYAIRTHRDLLSPALRTNPIYWCRPPEVSQRLFCDVHLLIGRELANAPATMAQLQERLQIPAARLASALAALRVVGSISIEKKRALGAPEGKAKSRSAKTAEHSPWPGNHHIAAGTMDMTAPAPLSVRRTEAF